MFVLLHPSACCTMINVYVCPDGLSISQKHTGNYVINKNGHEISLSYDDMNSEQTKFCKLV
jgi:hypothetical protein